MPDAPFGPVSGYIEGQQAQQSLAMGAIKLKEEDIALQQADMMLQNQRKFAAYMAQLNSGGATPGQAAGDMANQLASRLFAVSDAALKSGMPEQAAEILTKAEAVQKGHIQLETAALQQQLDRATLTANIVKDIDPNDPNASEKFKQGMTLWAGLTGQQPNPEYLNAPFTKELKDKILSVAETRQQEASRLLEEQRLKTSQAEEELARKRQPLVEEQTRGARVRADAVEKAGGHTKAEQKQVDALVDVNHDIDDMIRQLNSLKDDDESLTGLSGRAHSVMETIKTFSGRGSQATPVHDFETSMEALRLKLPRAMTGVSRSAKDERDAAATLTDLRKPGINKTVALKRLQKLKSLVTGQIERSGIKPTEEQPNVPPESSQDHVDTTNW